MFRTTALVASVLAAGFSISTYAQSSTNDVEAAAGAPLSPADGGPRRWQLKADRAVSLHIQPSLDVPVGESIAHSTVLANLGCEDTEGSVWCLVKPIRGKRRGYVLAEHLQPALAPDGKVPVGIDTSVLRAKKGDFDERAEIPCAQERGQSMGICTVGVSRGSGSDATVVARFSNGFERTLYFVHGEFISANATMSGNGTDTDWTMQGDVYVIRVDDQRFELNNEFVFGG